MHGFTANKDPIYSRASLPPDGHPYFASTYDHELSPSASTPSVCHFTSRIVDTGSRRMARSTLRYRAGTGGACVRAAVLLLRREHDLNTWSWDCARGSSSVPATWVAREVELSGQVHVDMKWRHDHDEFVRSLPGFWIPLLETTKALFSYEIFLIQLL
jgi:hypothetical protein